MGRDLQKRKKRSSRPTIRQPNRLKKPLNPLGNSIIAKNWDKKETLSQNYRRLGLTAKLGKATGGVEHHTNDSPAAQDPLAVTPTSGLRAAIQAVKVERDADGKILRVLHKPNPLNDPLNDLEDDDDDDDDGEEPQTTTTTKNKPTGKIVDLLEAQASVPMEKKHVRHQSAREREWCERLIAKHGADNTAAMARDGKLNPMQQTEADIRKRLAAYFGKKGGQ